MLVASKAYFFCKVFIKNHGILRIINRLNMSRKMEFSPTVTKPPNVLVYTEDKFFKNIAKNLYKCLHADKYVIYHLKRNQVLTTPWKENVGLLVVFAEEIDKNIVKEFVHYLEKGGKLLVVCSNFSAPGICTTKVIEEDLIRIKYQDTEEVLCCGKYSYSVEKPCVLATDEKNNAVITRADRNEGIFIASAVQLVVDPSLISSLSKEQSTSIAAYSEKSLPILKSLLTEKFDLEGYLSALPAPTSGYVIVDGDIQLTDMMKLMTISDISLEKSSKAPSQIGQSPELKVPLLTQYDDLKSSLFDRESYFSTLKTDYFGRTVVFFPVVTSTMYPAEHLSDYPGLVVVANRQLSGKGRGDNVWISPEGSVAVTLHFPLMLSSKLGQRLSIMQHMASLAVVHGLRKQTGWESLDFCLKWPNDIYFEKDKKIGGVLVNTTIQGDVVHIYVGIGVNVSNQRPTVCVNSIINDHNIAKGDSLNCLKTEEVIATTLTELENLVKEFTQFGAEKFLDLYYKYWIHKDQNVTLSDSNVKAVVQSVDDYGFLVVQTEDGKKLSLQPDGNRFDMMKNLIIGREL